MTEGDQVQVGNFTLTFQRGESAGGFAVSSSTFLRPLEEFREDFHLEREAGQEEGADRRLVARASACSRRSPRSPARCSRSRSWSRCSTRSWRRSSSSSRPSAPTSCCSPRTARPSCAWPARGAAQHLAEAPVSQTILDLVTRQKVAVLTSDAQADERFSAGMSVRLHQIRSAMCAPLWHRDSVIGVLFVDTPLATGCFVTENLDLLTALANYAAVAIDRARLNDSIREEQRRARAPRALPLAGGGRGDRRQARLGRATASVTRPARSPCCSPTSSASRPAARPWSRTEVARFLNEFFIARLRRGLRVRRHPRQVHRRRRDGVLRRADAAGRPRRAGGAGRRLDLRRRVEWNHERELAGLETVEVRIAINSGLVVVGEIGSANRVDYTSSATRSTSPRASRRLVAQPGQIVIGDRRPSEAVAHLFPTEHLGNVAAPRPAGQAPGVPRPHRGDHRRGRPSGARPGA